MSKFTYHGDPDGHKVVVALPVLDAHLRPLVNCRVIDADSVEATELLEAKAAFTVEAGRPFVIDHTNHARGWNWVHDFCCSHPQFHVLDRDVLPRKPANPAARPTSGATRAGKNNG